MVMLSKPRPSQYYNLFAQLRFSRRSKSSTEQINLLNLIALSFSYIGQNLSCPNHNTEI